MSKSEFDTLACIVKTGLIKIGLLLSEIKITFWLKIPITLHNNLIIIKQYFTVQARISNSDLVIVDYNEKFQSILILILVQNNLD